MVFLSLFLSFPQYVHSLKAQEAPEAESVLFLKNDGMGGPGPGKVTEGQARWKPVEETHVEQGHG